MNRRTFLAWLFAVPAIAITAESGVIAKLRARLAAWWLNRQAKPVEPEVHWSQGVEDDLRAVYGSGRRGGKDALALGRWLANAENGAVTRLITPRGTWQFTKQFEHRAILVSPAGKLVLMGLPKRGILSRREHFARLGHHATYVMSKHEPRTFYCEWMEKRDGGAWERMSWTRAT